MYCKDDSRAGTSRNFSRSKSLPTSATNSAKLLGRKQSAPTCNLPFLLKHPLINLEVNLSGIDHHLKRTRQKKWEGYHQHATCERDSCNFRKKQRHSIRISDLSRASNTYNEHPVGVMSNGDNQTSGSTSLDDDLQSCKKKMEWTEQKLTPPSQKDAK
uniref:Uncharacterized protein n=1 Tax=Oryza punctata TaxID=4537 RepID=A0A0E0KXS3_ORYPU